MDSCFAFSFKNDYALIMILDVFFLAIGSLVNLVVSVLTPISFLVPSQAITALNYFANFLAPMQGFINFVDIFSALGWLMTFYTFWYTFKVMLWGFALIPFVGKHVSPSI